MPSSLYTVATAAAAAAGLFVAAPLPCATAEDSHYSVTCAANGAGGFNFTLAQECSDEQCQTCEETRTGEAPACVEEDHDGEVEYVSVSCDAGGATGTFRIYGGGSLAAGLGAAGCTDPDTLELDTNFTSGTCAEDDHGLAHHGEDEEPHIVLTCSATGETFELGIDCAEGCTECEETRTGDSGDCLREEHDGEVEYILVECDASGDSGTLFVYEASEGAVSCDAASGMEVESQELVSGVCTEDDHGHDEHAIDAAPAAAVSLAAAVASAATVIVAAAAVRR